jgi:hypothetical protein
MRSLVRGGIAHDAGVLFNTADTEHGASPTRSATVRRLTTLFLSDTSPSSSSFRILNRAAIFRCGCGPSCRRRGPTTGTHAWGETKLQTFGGSSATLQKMHNYFVADGADSPTQKIHCKDQRSKDRRSKDQRNKDRRNKDRRSVGRCATSYLPSNSPRCRASSQACSGSRPVTSLYQAGWNVHAQASLTAPRIMA